MEEALNQFLEQMFVGPLWPASTLVCCMILYTIVAMIGIADLGLDADVDMDMDVDVGVDADVGMDVDVDADVGGADLDVDAHVSSAGFLSGLGAMTVRWTNFGRVPIAIWGGVFTVALWIITYALWHGYDSARYAPVLLPSILLTIRNSVLAILVTKPVTQPLVGKFQPEPAYDKRRILGCTCEISSIEATPSFGQAKFRTNAAPLLLNVRTDGATIPKGTEVKIIDFQPEKRLYTVTNIEPEKQS